MANLIYDSYMSDEANGLIIPGTDTFYMMLVTSGYSPNKKTNTKRSNVTNEVTGTGYTAGGIAIPAIVTLDTTNDRCDVTFTTCTFINITVTGAVAGVIYKHRGGASSADNLVCYTDFGGSFSPVSQNFVYTSSAPLRTQN